MSDTAVRAMAQACVGPIVYAAASAALGHWFGGGVALERLDAALLIPTLPLAALAMVGIHRVRPGGGRLAILLPTALLLVLASMLFGTAAPRSQWPQLAVLTISSLSILTIMDAAQRILHRHSTALRWFVFILSTATWWLAAHVALASAYTVGWSAQPGKTIMLTGLPLRTWPDDRLALGELRDTAAIIALRTRLARPLVLADGLADGSLGPDDRLLLAHPRALPPETLVEVDRFVRAGGRVVILADGLSSWPLPYGFGDARNPPVTSLLTPLLDHWGIRLDAPVPGGANDGKVTIVHAGRRLTLHSPGNFARLPGDCRGAGHLVEGPPTIATCRIGRGVAVLLADADMLFDPLWRPEPLWAAHLRTSDNIEWLASQLNEPYRPNIAELRPTWRGAVGAGR